MYKVSKKLVITMIVLDIIAVFCLLLAYGPNKKFKNFLVTTAMATMNHKYLARTIYSEKTINQVLKENTIVELDEDIDLDAIKIGTYQTSNFETKEEKQVLKKNKGNDLYKSFKFKESGKTYYITVVYDPSKISLELASKPGVVGETVKTIVKNSGGVVGINASGFEDLNGNGNGARATGNVIKDGKVVWHGKNSRWGKGLIGFNKDHKLVLTKDTPTEAINKGMMDAVTFGPFLIINGKESTVFGNGGTGAHPRTVIAQRQDGIVLFITIDGNGSKYGYRGGATYSEMIEVLKRYKAYNAANLDGGASSILIINNKIINNPVGYGATGERRHPNAWVVKN